MMESGHKVPQRVTGKKQVEIRAITAIHWNAFRWCIVYFFILCGAGMQVASAYNGEYHYGLTIDAIKDEGFSQPQIDFMAQNNELVDMISTADESTTADVFMVPDVRDDSDAVEELFWTKAHFLDFPDNDAINDEWVRLQEQTYLSVKNAEKTKNTREFLATLGMSLHTVQDFYAHSNWADVTDNGEWAGMGYAGQVTWFDVKEKDKNACSGPLIHSMDHATINKDYPSRPHFETSYMEAYYASRQWIRLLKSWVGEEFLRSAMDPEIDTSSWGGNYYDLFMRDSWYVGAWNGPYSTSYDDLVSWCTANGYFPPVHLRDPEYRIPYRVAEDLGHDYLYNQVIPDLPPDTHPSLLEKIPDVRWLKIETLRVTQTDCDPLRDIDPQPGDQADFYPVITVNGHSYTEAPYQGRDTVIPNRWVTLIPLRMDARGVLVRYALFDDDQPLTSDDHCDIYPAYHEKDWERVLPADRDPQMVETNGLRQCIRVGRSDGDGNEAKVTFSYQFIPPGGDGENTPFSDNSVESTLV